jgi:peptide chain release factor 1
VPPTERRGRVHSSTITVAVLDPVRPIEGPWLLRAPHDFAVEWYSGSGAGGQHRNKTQNSCRVRHVPTGLVRSAQTRSRQNSLSEAMAALLAALDRMAQHGTHDRLNAVRQTAVGSGERSDKRRTVRFQANQVIDHVTGRTMTARDYMRGRMDLLWR